MFDQAEALRALVRDRVVCAGSVGRPPRVYTIAITSGKGGVGKTSLAVNLALLLSRAGRRVRLVDADFGLSNAEVMLGVKPGNTMDDVMRGGISAYDAWIDAPGGIKLLSSGSGIEDMANISGEIGLNLIDLLLSTVSDGEVVIIDTAPGINESVTSLLTFANEVMVVTTPEPTSITDSYAAIKVLTSRSREADITLIANCCNNYSQASVVAEGLDGVCRRFLGRSFQRYEYLPSDATMGWAVRIRRPLVNSSPHAPIASWLRKVAIKLDSRIRCHGLVEDDIEMVKA